MKKVVVAIVAALLLLPLLPFLIPKERTMDTVEAGIKNAGFQVENAREITPPQLGSIEQREYTIGDALVQLYHFDDEGEIAKQLEFQKPDAGSMMVESWNLAQSLGAAKPKNKPVSAGRNGMFLIVITGEDGGLRNRILQVFNKQ